MIILFLIIALVALIAIGIQHERDAANIYRNGIDVGKGLQAAEDISNELLVQEQAITRGYAYWGYDATKAHVVFTWKENAKTQAAPTTCCKQKKAKKRK